jgi:hypothetical protein
MTATVAITAVVPILKWVARSDVNKVLFMAASRSMQLAEDRRKWQLEYLIAIGIAEMSPGRVRAPAGGTRVDCMLSREGGRYRGQATAGALCR